MRNPKETDEVEYDKDKLADIIPRTRFERQHPDLVPLYAGDGWKQSPSKFVANARG